MYLRLFTCICVYLCYMLGYMSDRMSVFVCVYTLLIAMSEDMCEAVYTVMLRLGLKHDRVEDVCRPASRVR